MCEDTQALICGRCSGSLLAVVICHGRELWTSNPIQHLVRDKIESVVPRLCAANVWIGRCIEPAANLERARQSSGSGFLVQPEVQFVNGEIAVGRTQIPSKSIAIGVLGKRISLTDSPLVTQPVYWRKR